MEGNFIQTVVSQGSNIINCTVYLLLDLNDIVMKLSPHAVSIQYKTTPYDH